MFNWIRKQVSQFIMSVCSFAIFTVPFSITAQDCYVQECCEESWLSSRSLAFWGATVLLSTAIGVGAGYIAAHDNRHGEKGDPGAPGTNGTSFQVDTSYILTIQFLMNSTTTSTGGPITVSFFVSQPDGTVSTQTMTLPGPTPYTFNPVFNFP